MTIIPVFNFLITIKYNSITKYYYSLIIIHFTSLLHITMITPSELLIKETLVHI